MHSMRKITLLTLLVCLFPLGCLADGLVLALAKSPLSLPFYIAQSEGYFASEGLQLQVIEVEGGHRAMQLLRDGQAQVATASETVVMFNSFKGQDFSLLACFAFSKDDVKLIASKGSGVTRVEQLAGKRVATIQGAASHYYLDTLALLHGVDPASIQLSNLQPEAMQEALRQKQVDAIAVWQPYAYRAEHEVPDSRVLDDRGFHTLRFNIIIPRKLVQAADAPWDKLLRALLRAQSYIVGEPAKARAVLAERLHLDAAYIDWLWPRYHYQLTLDQSLITSLESEARWARSQGHVQAKSSPNYLAFIHSLPLRRVLPSAVGLTE
jgi:NitT/TauT family transport system substrate-binding protein